MSGYLERFEEALAEKSLPYDDFEDLVKQWIEIGSNEDEERFKEFFLEKGQEKQLPPHTEECICGKEELIHNHYIYNEKTKELLVVGSQCIKKFLPKENRGKKCITCRKRCKLHYRCSGCESRKNLPLVSEYSSSSMSSEENESDRLKNYIQYFDYEPWNYDKDIQQIIKSYGGARFDWTLKRWYGRCKNPKDIEWLSEKFAKLGDPVENVELANVR